MRNTKPLGLQGQKENPKPNPNVIFKIFPWDGTWCDVFHCHKIPLETQKATLSRKMLRDSWSSQKFSFKVFFEAHRLQKLCNSSLYLEGHLLTPKISLSLLKIKSYMEPHPTTNRQSCFKHQILSKSNKNCKILQNSKKKDTHEVSGDLDTIWPNFNPPATEQELPATIVSKISNLQSEHMDGLKIPPKGSMSNFKSNRHRLTLHQLSNGEIKPLDGENHRGHHSSNKEHG